MIGLVFEVSKDRLTDKEIQTNKQEQKHTDSSKQNKNKKQKRKLKKIKIKKKSPNKCVTKHFENMFDLMVGPILRGRASIKMNLICLVFCKIVFACKWNGIEVRGWKLPH